MNADWDSIIEKIGKNQDLVETIFYIGPLNRKVNEAEYRYDHYSQSIANYTNQQRKEFIAFFIHQRIKNRNSIKDSLNSCYECRYFENWLLFIIEHL